MSIRMRWAAVRVVSLAVAAWAAQDAQAGPMPASIAYDTTGTIGPSGIAGTRLVSFDGVDSGTLVPGSAFNLGKFLVTMPVDGASTTYTQTPFEITLIAKSFDGQTPPANELPVNLHGVLNGTVTASGASGLTALFDITPVPADGKNYPLSGSVPAFQMGEVTSTLTPESQDGQISLVPPSAGGITVVQARIDPVIPNPVPEPGSMAVFLALATYIGLKRRTKFSS